MKIEDYKKILFDIIHKSIYNSSTLSSEDSKIVEDLYKYFIDNSNAINDLRTLITLRNNDTKDVYDKYISNILVNVNNDIKFDILSSQDSYLDIIKNNNIFTDIYLSLSIEDKIKYLQSKKKYTDIDIELINQALKENNNFNDNKLLKEILSNEKIINKIPNNSIILSYNYSLLMNINLNDLDVCKILTKETYVKLLLKKCESFDEFVNYYDNNNKLFDLLPCKSLIFDNCYNESIYNFIMNNPKFIGKFNEKYLDLFSIVEINKMFNSKILDEDSYSTLFNKLFNYDPKKLLENFNEDTLKNCSKHSISVYLFDYINEDLRNKIFSNYSLFDRFVDTIMIEVINKHFSEDDIVDYLRNDDFVNDMSSYAIELLLNKLSFRSSFNMLQKKNILDKINHLNISVDNKDIVFIKGFLDSPSLIIKCDHSMVYNMLNLLSSDDILYYIVLPYITNNLSNNEIITLFLDKDISINELVNSDELLSKLKNSDIIKYIDNYFKVKLDLSIFNNSKLSKLLFNLSDDDIDKIDFNEVNYLYETIRMKSLLSKQEVQPTLINYRSVLISYLTLGLDGTLKFVLDGNKNVTLDKVLELKKIIIDEKVLKFKENNSAVFQNINKKMIDNLNCFNDIDSIDIFAREIKKNTYLDNIIYLMLDNNYDTYNNIINKLFGYVKYYKFNPFNNMKDIYDYCNGFVDLFISNQVNKYNDEFDKIILDNFKPKENILYNKRKEIGKNYLDKLKLKLFIRALTDNNKKEYVEYFNEGYMITEIKDKYIKYLNQPDIEFNNILEHILIPYSNDRFDYENCLNKININKPTNYDEYILYLNNLQNVSILNNEVSKIRNLYSDTELISIMNNACYDSELGFKANSKLKKVIEKLKEIISKIGNEIYVDKTSNTYIYSKNIDIYNIDEIIEYRKYNEIITNLIKKTFTYINKNMNNNNIKNIFAIDYFKNVNDIEYNFPINNKNYELKKRVFSLKDMEVIFNGYEINNYKTNSDSLNTFLFNNLNLVMVADGYYNGIVNNLGLIMSRWDNIIKYCEDNDLDINKIRLVDVEKYLTVINFKDNILFNCIDKDIINSICDDGYYEELDSNNRINMLIDLYKNKYKSVCSTIPFLSYKRDDIEIKTIDKYDDDTLLFMDNSIYKIGATGNDMVCYSLLDKNGCQIGIYENNNLVSKIYAVRNGNTLYLNGIDGKYDESYNRLLSEFSNELIKVTNEDIDPINYITIVNDNYNNPHGIVIDSTICPIINNPICTQYSDFKEFSKYNFLFNSYNIHSNFGNKLTTLLASNDIVDKNNFLYYDCEAKYLRKRNNVIKLSNNIGEEYINKIDSILYLCKLINNDNIDDISLSSMNDIYLGDDFVIFISDKNNIFKYVLPYDERANKEIELILDSIKD